jgi:ribosomal protein L29
MIKKEIKIMANTKREKTLEELQEELMNARQVCEHIQEVIKRKEAEEKAKKEKELAEVKDVRRKEIEELSKKLNQLKSSYVEDYGSLRLDWILGWI